MKEVMKEDTTTRRGLSSFAMTGPHHRSVSPVTTRVSVVAVLMPPPLKEPGGGCNAMGMGAWSASKLWHRNGDDGNDGNHAHADSSTSSRSGGGGTALHLSTYSAGEDGGRLAAMAREFGLSRARGARRQVRRHVFEAFLRNQPSNLNLSEDVSREPETGADEETKNAEATKSPEDALASPTSTPPPAGRHPPLRFVFSGYSLWLELEQEVIDADGRGDLDRAMIDAADEFRLGGAIPSPHVTALYGIDTIDDEEEVRRLFRDDVTGVLMETAERKGTGKMWPDLDATGIIVDVEFDGVNGGEMDMAWAEVSLATSPEHEELLDALHELYYRPSVAKSAPTNDSTVEEKRVDYAPRSNPWMPHLSLCYDNPEQIDITLSRPSIEEFIQKQCPTLANLLDDSGDGNIKFTRSVSGIALWRTAGTMAEWECLDRFVFPTIG